jgi:hypothetical protein
VVALPLLERASRPLALAIAAALVLAAPPNAIAVMTCLIRRPTASNVHCTLRSGGLCSGVAGDGVAGALIRTGESLQRLIDFYTEARFHWGWRVVLWFFDERANLDVAPSEWFVSSLSCRNTLRRRFD